MPQLALDEIFMERQLRLTGGEHHLWLLKNSNEVSYTKSTCLPFRRLLIGQRSAQRLFIDGFQIIKFLQFDLETELIAFHKKAIIDYLKKSAMNT